MLEEVLMYLNNWFVTEKYQDTYTISDGGIVLPFLQDGQYFRIMGSIFNDGVYQYGSELSLKDETFDGQIWALAIPHMLIDLVKEIKEWQDKYGDTVAGPYTSESFGGYSYSKGSSSSSAASNKTSWMDFFGARLAPYKKLKGCEYGTPRPQKPPYRRPFNPDYPYNGG